MGDRFGGSGVLTRGGAVKHIIMQTFNCRVSAILLACLLPYATLAVRAGTEYVDLNNPSPAAPYTTWSTAATNIQDAIDAAGAGDLVLVTNGVYQTGGRVVYGAMTNRVAVTKPLTLQSVNGPGVTTIMGYQVPGTTNGNAAVRCVYLTNNAVLSGFTLTNGATRSAGAMVHEQSGGGVWCESTLGTVSNCVIVGNAAFFNGGGASQGTIKNCILTGNLARANGGGATLSTLNNCRVSGNSATNGGGVASGILTNCLLNGNFAAFRAGGVYESKVFNCTVSGNSALYGAGGVRGSPTFIASVINCVIYDNIAPKDSNYDSSVTPSYSCTMPLPAGGKGSFTNAPLFVDPSGGDFHLQPTSPCINSGGIGYVVGSYDLDGNPRIQGGTVDVGAYELQNPTSVLSYAWLQQFDLPVDGSADFADSDGDGMNNWQEWVAGTNPTNAASLLTLTVPTLTPGRVTLSWSSVTNRNYFVQRATDLSVRAPFALLQNNIKGLSGITSYTDTNAPSPAYYRVGVQ
jgi:hypothetical protein